MKNFFAIPAALTIGISVLFLFSCKSLPPQEIEPSLTEAMPGAMLEQETVPEEKPVALELAVPREDFVLPGVHIMGQGMVPGETLAAFLLQVNTAIDANFVHSLSGLYVEEAAKEGINHDMAFAQMCLETGFLRFGGLVTPDMNNFCGLGAIGPRERGLYFPDTRIGVRAHIQHLKAYASTEPLNTNLVDPRFRYVTRGSAPTIHGLTGTWAVDRSYDVKIARILENLYDFAF
ncbi:MAG: glucosaminidase domain-containing protein [Treponema sp.]|jgi:hypothetical protein|nr:glucosaminidase domain-containing protein [Treponema sp.]